MRRAWKLLVLAALVVAGVTAWSIEMSSPWPLKLLWIAGQTFVGAVLGWFLTWVPDEEDWEWDGVHRSKRREIAGVLVGAALGLAPGITFAIAWDA